MSAAASEKVCLDLNKASRCLEAVLDIIEELNGERLDIDYLKRNNAELAVVTRDLLHASQMAHLAASEINMQYWRVKGFTDPREPK